MAGKKKVSSKTKATTSSGNPETPPPPVSSSPAKEEQAVDATPPKPEKDTAALPTQGRVAAQRRDAENSSDSSSSEADPEISGDGTDVIKSDGYLEPHHEYFRQRYAHFKRWVDVIDANEGGIDKFSQGYKDFGLHVTPEG
ncbi:alpha-1,4-glucan branching enzyme, partial [Coemansia sp. RSA 2559]